jgi:hypothetical protein
MNLVARSKLMAIAALLASILLTACSQHSITASTETPTVYEDKPTLKLLDLGPPGNSPGDVYHFLLHYIPAQAVPSQARCLVRKRLSK